MESRSQYRVPTLVCDCTVVHRGPCLLAGQLTTTWGVCGGWVGVVWPQTLLNWAVGWVWGFDNITLHNVALHNSAKLFLFVINLYKCNYSLIRYRYFRTIQNYNIILSNHLNPTKNPTIHMTMCKTYITRQYIRHIVVLLFVVMSVFL